MEGNMDVNDFLDDSLKMCEFVNLAISEGYSEPDFWVEQYYAYQSGNRGPDMHDFTLANLSK
jgi:hypothetical protein